MKQLVFLLRLSLLLILCHSNDSRASHVLGGEISYTWISGNTYEFNLSYYRDCNGVSAPFSQLLNITSSVCNVQMAIILLPVAGTPSEIQNICPSVINSCNGGSASGIQKWVYSGSVTLPLNCPDYYISFSECCRPGYQINIDDNAYFFATLDNFNVPFNNSVQYLSEPVMFLITGHHYNINNAAFDEDGDSLVFTLQPAKKDSISNVRYAPGYSYQSPFTSTTPIYLNPSSGDFTLTPQYQEANNIVFHTDEYRNGILVGTSSRDIRILSLNDSNSPPSLGGINNSSYNTSQTCAGDTVRFTIYSTDPDLSDTTQILWSSTGLGNFTVSNSGGSRDSVSIELITDSAMARINPYQLHLSVKDNHCPSVAFQSYSYQVYVNGCSSNIWPGDANADLKCDLYDVFPIGLAYGTAGPLRPGATINWTPENNSDWSQNFSSGVNYKHSDCNGDGIIDNNDLNAIAQNFSLTHPLRLSNPNITSASDFAFVVANQDSVNSGDSITVEIKLGSLLNPINSIYGIAFELNFDPSILDTLQNPFEFIQSPLGTPGLDLLTFIKTDLQQGIIYAAAVRTDQNNSTSDSSIALFKVKIRNNIPANTSSILYLTGVRGIDANDSIHTVNAINDTLFINISNVGIQNTSEIKHMYFFPNPAMNELTIRNTNNTKGLVMIYDMSGRKIIESSTKSLNTKIDISLLSNGIYAVVFSSPEGLVRKKLVVSR